jgi:hypothetical protein
MTRGTGGARPREIMLRTTVKENSVTWYVMRLVSLHSGRGCALMPRDVIERTKPSVSYTERIGQTIALTMP